MGVQSCWLSQNHRGQGVFHFAGVNSINEAEKFRGLDVLLPFEQRVSLPAGQYFVADLIGCAVFEMKREAAAVASSPCCDGYVRRNFWGRCGMCSFRVKVRCAGRRCWKWRRRGGSC